MSGLSASLAPPMALTSAIIRRSQGFNHGTRVDDFDWEQGNQSYNPKSKSSDDFSIEAEVFVKLC
jgi:hypothetical protein